MPSGSTILTTQTRTILTTFLSTERNFTIALISPAPEWRRWAIATSEVEATFIGAPRQLQEVARTLWFQGVRQVGLPDVGATPRRLVVYPLVVPITLFFATF